LSGSNAIGAIAAHAASVMSPGNTGSAWGGLCLDEPTAARFQHHGTGSQRLLSPAAPIVFESPCQTSRHGPIVASTTPPSGDCRWFVIAGAA